MDALSIAINESQWMLCLVQVTGVMLIGWIVGRLILRKFPDIAASIGVVVLAASAGLVVLTLAGVPRPFELSAISKEVSDTSTYLDSELSSVVVSNSDVEVNGGAASWLSRLASFVNFSAAPASSTGDREFTWQVITLERCVTLLVLLTLLGGLVGVFRVAHSFKTIYSLAISSSQIDDKFVLSEVSRIVAQLPTEIRHRGISVHQFEGPGSPFVSWLTGSKIFVPETFSNWSRAEQSAGLAHEIAHLLRRDHFSRLITQLTFCLTWLHPLAWLLHRQTVLAQEIAADHIAAQVFKNPTAYCRGLSRLALRFDAECRHTSALGVSVSSSLIRRITMLKEITFHRLPCSRSVNRCIALSTFVACTWIGCWAVEGQTATPEKEPDSKVVTASHIAPVKMFSQPTTQPWETIGNPSGYMKIQLSRMLKHPDLKAYRPMLTAALDGVLLRQHDETPSLKQFGLNLDKIDQIQSGMFISYSHDPKQPEGQRSRINFFTSPVEVSAFNQVDWPGLIKAVDLSKIFYWDISPSDLDKMRQTWLTTARKSRSNVFQNGVLEMPNTKGKQPNETKKAVWEAVSGGVATVVYDIPQIVETSKDLQKTDDLERVLFQANLNMTVATETAAWGIDLSPDYKSCRIRFAAVPKADASTDDLIGKFEVVREAFVEKIGDTLEGMDRGDNEFEFWQHFLEQSKKLKVSVVAGAEINGERTKDYLLVEGECSAFIFRYFTGIFEIE